MADTERKGMSEPGGATRVGNKYLTQEEFKRQVDSLMRSWEELSVEEYEQFVKKSKQRQISEYITRVQESLRRRRISRMGLSVDEYERLEAALSDIMFAERMQCLFGGG